MKSKTTIVGILMIAGAVCQAAVQLLTGQHPDFSLVGAAIIGGIGFIHSADAPPKP